ncbi:MAG: hypothetical protein OER43_10170 [Gammaproteobacteria bacterium]|nr:hypothetical protein [Gammaproteobacteria bacterium]MDH3413721.1 hypothetical protein [Gammaproteobacteria bacterium]
MSNFPASAATHLNWLLKLQQQLSGASAAVLQHEYLLLLMGSFTLVIGTAHQRLKFEWDGRDFFLDIAQCTCQSQSSPQQWSHVQNMRIAPPEQVQSVIERKCKEIFDT